MVAVPENITSQIVSWRIFPEDEYPPNAILLEYIPNIEMIPLHNFTTEKADGFIEGIREIHKAGVRHGHLDLD